MAEPAAARDGAEKTMAARWMAAAKWPGQAWIFSGIYLFWTRPGAVIYSRKALLFFLGGTAAACILLGFALYLAERAVAAASARLVPSPSVTAAALIAATGILLVAADMLAAYCAAGWVFDALG